MLLLGGACSARQSYKVAEIPLKSSLAGFEALRSHVPQFRSIWGLLNPLLAILAVFAATSLFFLAADRNFPAWMPDGEIVILALGFLILSRFFTQRKRYQQKYGAGAFAQALWHFSVPGLGFVTASIGHLAYMAGPGLPNVWWKSWLIAAGYLLIVSGIILWLRAVTKAGIDQLAMLYVYFPGEGSQVDSGIYGLLRHPIYAAAQDIGFGLAFIHANWYALLVAFILPLFFAGWIRLIEEPELIERYPDYAEYRKRVPAFGPSPGRLVAFWRLLLTGR